MPQGSVNGKPAFQAQDLRNSKLAFCGSPVHRKQLILLCHQCNWNMKLFYPLYACYLLLLLTSFELKFDPIADPVAYKSNSRRNQVVQLAGASHED